MSGEPSAHGSASNSDTRGCPECGGELRSISDPFRGPTEAIDNFDEVEDHLREEGVVSDTHPLVLEHGRERVAELDVEVPDDGPYVVESIVCTETSCLGCSFSRRTYTPPEQVAAMLADALGGD